MGTQTAREDAASLTRRFHQARRTPSQVILVGFHPLKHALRFGAQVRAVVSFDADELTRLADRLAPDLAEEITRRAQIVSHKVFKQLGPYEPHTGVVAIADRPQVDVGALLTQRHPAPLILLEDPRHRGNLGAVIRVAAAAEAAGVLSTGACDPWDPVAVRGSAGLHFALPVAYLPALPEPSATSRPLLALDPEGEPLREELVPPGALLVFGSEREGLSEQLRARADACVSLPMRPGVSSLNLATSVAAVLYGIRLLDSRR